MRAVLAKICLAAALAVSAMAGAAPAYADPADDAIAARKGYFKLLAANLGPLGAMAKGETDYDAEVAENHGANLEALGAVDVGFLFLPGTDNAAMPGKTRSLPAIWTDGGGITEKVEALSAATDGFGAAAGGGLASLRQSIGPVGAACASCHKAYRAK